MSTDEHYEQQVNRRGFLRAVTATVVAATATGAGAAALLQKGEQAPQISSQLAPMGGGETAVSASASQSELLARLAAAQADNVRLQSQLDLLQEQLAAAQNNQGQQGANSAMQTQLNEAHGQINLLNGQVGALAGLVTLYEQLEQVDLEGVVADGFSVVDTFFDELSQNLPSVDEGLAAGRQALDQFEAQVDILDSGRSWLESQLAKVSLYFDAVEAALQNALEAADSFLQLLNSWFQEIMKWLPFGIGEKASGVMTALSDLMAEVPYTLAGLRANVAQPLDELVGRDGEEMRVQQRLVRPLREGVIGRSEETVSRVTAVKTAYQQQLQAPTRTVSEQRQAVLTSITEYRQQHQL